ncbi:MAG: heavy-metal-associated domain-containing protein [Gemmatimonadota bacterium]|nr:heavy-metal-associated domain-containing protein [Gemmatimonadota bacterium]
MRYELTIEGMLAVHARHAVFTALAAVGGITRADVELGRVVVEHDGSVTEAALRDAIGAAGFAVTRVVTLPRALPTL